jgi:cytochrome d ubiquinol oxidase subunit II
VATFFVQPLISARLAAHPSGLVFVLVAVAGFILVRAESAKGSDARAFLSSCFFLAGLLASTAFGLFPRVLPSSSDPAWSLTVFGTAAADPGLRVALWWWVPGMLLVTGYFVFLYRNFAGKVGPDEAHSGEHTA